VVGGRPIHANLFFRVFLLRACEFFLYMRVVATVYAACVVNYVR
jgi:hypothetical protein